jgi:hypothetical protein
MFTSIITRSKFGLSKAATVVALGLACAGSVAQAGAIQVYVGYADGLRGPGFFPNPWNGDTGVTFIGDASGSADAGAIRIDNVGATSMNITDISVTMAGGQNFDLWGNPGTLLPGNKLIVTETAHYNFDTSDYPTTSPGFPWPDGETAHAPHISITIDGTVYNFLDTGHILDTGGFDYAAIGNESFQWRPVGTTGTSNPGGNPNVPDSTGIEVLLMGTLSLGGFSWVLRKAPRR